MSGPDAGVAQISEWDVTFRHPSGNRTVRVRSLEEEQKAERDFRYRRVGDRLEEIKGYTKVSGNPDSRPFQVTQKKYVPADAGVRAAPMDAGPPADAGARQKRGPVDAGAVVDAARRVQRARKARPSDYAAPLVEPPEQMTKRPYGPSPQPTQSMSTEEWERLGQPDMRTPEVRARTDLLAPIEDAGVRDAGPSDAGLVVFTAKDPVTGQVVDFHGKTQQEALESFRAYMQKRRSEDGSVPSSLPLRPVSDAGTRDAGAFDGGVRIVSTRDAGSDAGPRDAGLSFDAGARDAGSSFDAGPPRSSRPPSSLAVEPLARPPATAATHYGARVPGNIDLSRRPYVQNDDGSVSTVYSMGFQDRDGKQVLIPLVSDDGRIMTPDEGIATYRRTGRHLGKYDTPEESDAAGEAIHQDQMRHPPTDTLQGRGMRPRGGVSVAPSEPLEHVPRTKPSAVVDPKSGQRLVLEGDDYAGNLERALEFSEKYPGARVEGDAYYMSALEDAKRAVALREKERAKFIEAYRRMTPRQLEALAAAGNLNDDGQEILKRYQRVKHPTLGPTLEEQMAAQVGPEDREAGKRARMRREAAREVAKDAGVKPIPESGGKPDSQFRHWATVQGASGPVKIGGDKPEDVERLFNAEVQKNPQGVRIIDGDHDSKMLLSPAYKKRAEAGRVDAGASPARTVITTEPVDVSEPPPPPPPPKGSLRQRVQDAGAIVRGAPSPKGQGVLGDIAREARGPVDAGVPEPPTKPFNIDDVIAADEAKDKPLDAGTRPGPQDSGLKKSIADAAAIISDTGVPRKPSDAGVPQRPYRMPEPGTGEDAGATAAVILKKGAPPRDAGIDRPYQMPAPGEGEDAGATAAVIVKKGAKPSAPVPGRPYQMPEPGTGEDPGGTAAVIVKKKPDEPAPTAPPAAPLPPKKGSGKWRQLPKADVTRTPAETSQALDDETNRQVKVIEQQGEDRAEIERKRAERLQELMRKKGSAIEEAKSVFDGSRKEMRDIEVQMRSMIDDIRNREGEKPKATMRDWIFQLIGLALANNAKTPAAAAIAKGLTENIMPNRVQKWAEEISADKDRLRELDRLYQIKGHGLSHDAIQQKFLNKLVTDETVAALQALDAEGQSKEVRSAARLIASKVLEAQGKFNRGLEVEDRNKERINLMESMSIDELRATRNLDADGQRILERKLKERREQEMHEADVVKKKAEARAAEAEAGRGPKLTEKQFQGDVMVASQLDSFARIFNELVAPNGGPPSIQAMSLGHHISQLNPKDAQARADVRNMMNAINRFESGAVIKDHEMEERIRQLGLDSPYTDVRINGLKQLRKEIEAMDVRGRLSKFVAGQPFTGDPTDVPQPQSAAPQPVAPAVAAPAPTPPQQAPVEQAQGMADPETWPANMTEFRYAEESLQKSLGERFKSGKPGGDVRLHRADNSWITKRTMEDISQGLKMGYTLTPRPATEMRKPGHGGR